VGASLSNELFACQLGDSVNIDRLRRIVFRIGRLLGSIKDIVSADVDAKSVHTSAGPCHPQGTETVHTEGVLGPFFGVIDTDKRGTIDYNMRPLRDQRLLDRSRIGTVNLPMSEATNVVIASFDQNLDEIRPQLA
jgi:hypothetical protein